MLTTTPIIFALRAVHMQIAKSKSIKPLRKVQQWVDAPVRPHHHTLVLTGKASSAPPQPPPPLASHHRPPPFLFLCSTAPPFSLSARPIFKAISPDLKNASTDHQGKSFVYLLLPFVSQSLFSRQRRGRRRALPHCVVRNRFLAGMPKSRTVNGVEVNYDSYDDDHEHEENHQYQLSKRIQTKDNLWKRSMLQEQPV
ncbi:14 kDa proline-rich protein DC2.15 [Trifolium repens]|nr:14 kDa proline-rich protein DC2.15 [Trifolium repens]